MKKSRRKWKLDDLLDCCCNPRCSDYEAAWEEFIHRYRSTLYEAVYRRCKSWQFRRLQTQFDQVVNDIVNDIFFLLCQNNGQALCSFRKRDDESRFKVWLQTIAHRATSRHLIQLINTNLLNDDVLKIMESDSMDIKTAMWEIYESIVTHLRNGVGKNKIHTERDIHIFLLNKWAGLSPSMIIELPSFRDMNPQMVYNSVNRMRQILPPVFS